jgi:predicted ATPase
MKIKSITINDFRRFHSLSIPDLPPAKLVIMAGPNGSGKSSLFDAFLMWKQFHSGSWVWDHNYHGRNISQNHNQIEQIQITFDCSQTQKSFYIRSAYRNDPDFTLSKLSKLPDASKELTFKRMIEYDNTVAKNYERLCSDALQDIFENSLGSQTISEFRVETIGEIRSSLNRVFNELDLNTLGNPLTEGKFRFSKGAIKNFDYKILSGGEKAAFDLLLDMIVKKRYFNDTVFCIDEPELHINTRLQGALLEELYNLTPENCQLWIATHSIGMMRKALDLYKEYPEKVIFLDFEDHNFDEHVTLNPVAPTRKFWESILHVALDDLAHLVAPKQIVICEGNPKTQEHDKNHSHDARCYDTIFSDQYPDIKFISGGNSKEVSGDRLRFANAFPRLISGLNTLRLIDRDDHSPEDVAEFKEQGIRVLQRRNIESYLYDEEVLKALYEKENIPLTFEELVPEVF